MSAGMAATRKHPGSKVHRTETRKEHLDRVLDDALEQSFPASDPPAVLRSGGKAPRPHGRIRSGATMVATRNAG